MEKNTGEIILHSRFRPLAGFRFLFVILDLCENPWELCFRPLAGFMFLFGNAMRA